VDDCVVWAVSVDATLFLSVLVSNRLVDASLGRCGFSRVLLFGRSTGVTCVTSCLKCTARIAATPSLVLTPCAALRLLALSVHVPVTCQGPHQC
jgi:hypothetical protein